MLKSVHGALVDAGCEMGPVGKTEAAQVRQLAAERDAAWHSLEHAEYFRDLATEDRDVLRREVIRLRLALAFYADPGTWRAVTHVKCQTDGTLSHSTARPIDADGGTVALAARIRLDVPLTGMDTSLAMCESKACPVCVRTEVLHDGR